MDYPTGEKLPLPWATWVPDRRPQFKVHANLRLAKRSVSSAIGPQTRRPDGDYAWPIRGGVLYQIVGDRWIVRAVIKPGSFKDEHILFTAPRKWMKDPTITSVIAENPFNV